LLESCKALITFAIRRKAKIHQELNKVLMEQKNRTFYKIRMA